jgi:eukaryotic-like serine/threonine-protein kinase
MTLSETFRADLEWPSLEGAILDGGYELKHTLGHTAEEAVFQVRVLGGAGLELTAKFHRADGPQAAAQLLLWELLRELPHRNVSAPLASGRKSVHGRETVYVLLAIPDDKLAALAGERALTEDEAREVLRSVARALSHLHANGLAHGCLSPETILARGETIQLAGECVRRLNDAPPIELTKPRYLAPECDAFQATAPADVWCVGATLFEALAQKPYPADPKESRADIAGFPPVLAVILRRCLATDPARRATLTEVLAILDKGPSAALEVPREDEEDTPSSAASDIAPDIAPEQITVENIAPDNPPDTGVPLELGEIETGASGADLPEIPIIQAPLPPKQITLDIVDDKPLSDEVASAPDASPAPPPVAAPVPIESRHRPIQARRQPVEARFLPLEQSEQDAALLALTKFVPPVKERRGIRLKAGAWRGFVAGAAALLMVAAVVWQVIIPRLQTGVENTGPTRGASSHGHPGGSAWVTRTLPAGDGTLPDARRQPVPQDLPADASGATATIPASAWRVVLYAYEHQSDAERRVELVNHNHPGLRAHLFVAGNGGPYLVVTGDATTQEHAQALRKKAMQLGVPRAHVQEFTQ